MEWGRLVRHLLLPPWRLRRRFPAATLAAIEMAIARGETRHAGQVRFAVEHALPPAALWRGQTAWERALEVFAQLRVWDTEHNSGVLVYLLLADRDVEIVADRGIAARVGQAEWEALCRRMETDFRRGDFAAGSLAGIEAVGALLARHFPARPGQPDELPDRPVEL